MMNEQQEHQARCEAHEDAALTYATSHVNQEYEEWSRIAATEGEVLQQTRASMQYEMYLRALLTDPELAPDDTQERLDALLVRQASDAHQKRGQ